MLLAQHLEQRSPCMRHLMRRQTDSPGPSARGEKMLSLSGTNGNEARFHIFTSLCWGKNVPLFLSMYLPS
jgi:hypothetical protein